MFQRSKLLTLNGVVRLKAINSPAYFNQLAQEARSLFDASDAELVFNMGKGIGQDEFPPVFAEGSNKLAKKFLMTGGAILNFLPASVTFMPKEKIIMRYDILAEITIRDGIVTKIGPVPLPDSN